MWVGPESANAAAALSELRRAKVLLEQAADWLHLAQVLEFLGYEGWWYGEFDGALAGWNEMADVARAHDMPALEAQAVLNISKVVRMRGDNLEANRLLERARQLAEQAGSRLIKARVERVLGAALAITKSVEEGRRLLASAAEVLEEVGDFDEFSVAEMFLGDLEWRDGRGDEALGHYERAIRVVQDHIGYRPELKRRIATVLLHDGRLAEAATYAEEAFNETAKDDFATVAVTHTVLGEVRAAQGRFEEAEQLLRKGAEVVSKTEFPGFIEVVALATFLVSKGEIAEGLVWLTKARDSIRELPTGSPLRDFLEKQADEVEAAAQAATSK
jgi:tetratricopeptide (TPR) repeat protein